MRPGDRSLDTTPLDNTADVVVTPALEAETERLLSQRTRDIRFSPEMVRAYRKKDWPQRSKIARAWMVWVALISIATRIGKSARRSPKVRACWSARIVVGTSTAT